MEDLENFRNPPIKEAVISIQFESKLASLDLIEGLINELPTKFSFSEPLAINGQSVSVQMADDGKKPKVESNIDKIGIRLNDEEQALTVQFRMNEFSISKMAPYTSWCDFKNLAYELWNLYLNKLVKVEYTRLAVRYINEIDLPLEESGSVEIEDYLTNELKTPKGMPEDVCNFFSRVEVPYPDTGVKAVIVQAFKGHNNESRSISVILDFDIYSAYLEGMNNESIWPYLEELRNIKNIAFRGSLTDKTMETFR